MADDARLAELRGLMAEALDDKRQYWDPEELQEIVSDLLPVVSAWAEQDREQHAARRAAEELLDAAYVIEANRPRIPPSTDPKRLTSVIVRSTVNQAVRSLRARAAALTPATEEGL